jgi:hypothetical protein
MSDIIADTPEKIAMFRLLSLKHALTLEIRGMKRSRGPSAHSILKNQYGYKGSRQAVLDALNAKLGK